MATTELGPHPRDLTENEIRDEIQIMQTAGLENVQIRRLANLRDRIREREVDDLTMEYKRHAFAKFLYERGLLS